MADLLAKECWRAPCAAMFGVATARFSVCSGRSPGGRFERHRQVARRKSAPATYLSDDDRNVTTALDTLRSVATLLGNIGQEPTGIHAPKPRQ